MPLHKRARSFIETELAKPFDGKTVVVTHHAPSLVCEHPKFGIDPLSGAFISDCDELIAQAVGIRAYTCKRGYLCWEMSACKQPVGLSLRAA